MLELIASSTLANLIISSQKLAHTTDDSEFPPYIHKNINDDDIADSGIFQEAFQTGQFANGSVVWSSMNLCGQSKLNNLMKSLGRFLH